VIHIAAKHMAHIEWKLLPALWPSPAIYADVGECMLLVFTSEGVPTWEVRRGPKANSSRNDIIASGTADTFEAAKAAALYEVGEQSQSSE